MLRGLTTVRFHAADLTAAKEWYTELLGVEPYFNKPGYVEFRFGDYQHELGLLDSDYARELADDAKTGPGGVVTYWHVDDVPAALDRLLSMGAKEHEPPREFGDGFVGASVIDPFGNLLGIMYNRHYLDVLHSIGKA
ncbi:VOC family protein [Streptosporangium sp. NPDC023963]|uniref:VOC family protein n=1 Tax=Streptosporangium sp. NPDC023963 TaxID=3155608 RepID=UPI00344ADCAF